MNDLLFIYGTLLKEDNEYAGYLKNNSTFYSKGRLKGKLYDIGEYPGAILSDDDDTCLYGNIVKMIEPDRVLPVINDYEGFGVDQSYPNEFIRVLGNIETGIGIVTCWIYLYNLPITGLAVVKDGRYIK